MVLYPTPPPEGSKTKKHDIGVQEIFFRAPLAAATCISNFIFDGEELGEGESEVMLKRIAPCKIGGIFHLCESQIRRDSIFTVTAVVRASVTAQIGGWQLCS